MPRGHSKYLDDAYGSFVEDVRLAFLRAQQYQGTVNEGEWEIIVAVHDTLVRFDPDAANVFPPRAGRKSNVA